MPVEGGFVGAKNEGAAFGWIAVGRWGCQVTLGCELNGSVDSAAGWASGDRSTVG